MSIRPRPVVVHEDDDRVAQTQPSVIEALGTLFFGGSRTSQALGSACANAAIGAIDTVFQDRMGAPNAIRRDRDYAVLAERGEGNVVAFSHATLEEAMECLSLGARTRRFVIELNHYTNTWSESGHTGDCPAADERIRAWLREELAKL